ncbi:MAG: DNA topoisomerase III [Candidatus Thiodiazotropha sp.]
MTRLFLCEKPSQGRDIARVLGANGKGDGCLRRTGVTVTWCFGHLLEMASPEGYGEQYKRWSLENLPILPERWRLEVKKDARKQFRIIKALLVDANEVVIATDADREGETIAREVLQLCRWQGLLSRLWLSAMNEASIRKALAELRPGEQTQPLYWAGLGRARADWLVGMNLTRAYTVIGRAQGHDGLLSVGRVQTPTLRLVVDHDRVIKSFRPVPYWDVLVDFISESGRFRARWMPADTITDIEGRCINERAARTLGQKLAGKQGSVADIETKRHREPPPLPYDLGTLQQEADRRFGLGAQEVLDMVQSLYETHKTVTYPRTDCPYLPESMLQDVHTVLEALCQSDPGFTAVVESADMSLRSRAWNDSRITAHHAIIPTTAPADISRMSESELQVYDLIRRRYLAQFHPAHEYDRTRVSVSVENERFQATGRRVLLEGWKSLYASNRQGAGEEGDDQELPQMEKSAACSVATAEVVAKQTKPPARFTEGTLVAAMKNVGRLVTDERLRKVLKETSGIGTDATRGSIIKTLLERGFLVKRKKHLISTDTARALIDALPAPVKDPGTTALWEQALDEIAQGRGNLDEFVRRQADWVSQLVARAKQSGELAGVSAQQHPCPECGKPMQRRKGRNGVFWGCSGYPECGVTLRDNSGKPGSRQGVAIGKCQCGGDIVESPKAWRCKACNSIVWKEFLRRKLTQNHAVRLLGGETLELRGLVGKSGKKFNSQVRIEDSRLTLLFDDRDTKPPRQSATTGAGAYVAGNACPECGEGNLVQRSMKSGRNEGRLYLGCTRYPKCRVFSWLARK